MSRPYEWEELRLSVPGSRVAASPMMLIQEMVPSRWAAVVGAVLCQRTRREVSHPTTWRVLQRWPDPKSLWLVDEADLIEVIRPCGLYRRRAKTLKMVVGGMWLTGGRPVRDRMPGLGQYVQQSDEVFGVGKTYINPADVELNKFVHWCRSNDHDPEAPDTQ